MHIEHIVSNALVHIFRPILRRALVAGVVAAFGAIAIYHFTVAGTLQLEAQFGALQAQLIVAAIYTALALIACLALWRMRVRSVAARAPMPRVKREDKIAMLLEAVMLGFARSEKRERAK